MTNYSLALKSVSKTFGRRLIFKGIELDCPGPGVWGIAGPNGSGKSTLIKIISGIIKPRKGKVVHSVNGKPLEYHNLHNYIGLSSPYLVMYDEFSAQENINLIMKIRNKPLDQELNDRLFQHFSLFDRRKDLVRAYSSGMKQRLKIIFSFIHNPELIILDEPTSNLDNEGKEKVYTLIKENAEKKIILIASNEETDLALCKSVLNLSDYKNKKN